MIRRKGNTTAAREAERFRAEARAAFGQRATAQPVDIPTGYDPQAARKEEQRLAATHDAGRSSACRLCGVAVSPSDTHTEVAGWKTCGRCLEVLPLGLAGVLSDVLGLDVAPDEAEEVALRLGVGNPCRFVRGWPTDEGSPTRWAHVDPGHATHAPAVLAELRARGTPRPNTYASGCAMCGVSVSTRWTETPFRLGRNGPRLAACADCQRAILGPGGDHATDWRPRLLAQVTGMRKPQLLYDLGVKAWFESNPVDPSGTAEPWSYLGTTRAKLRGRVIRSFPRLVHLTDNERRVLALEEEMAAAQLPERPPLADIDV